MADNKPELQRGLEARHIELIALGHHWRRPVYGGRQYPEVGRAIRIVGLYHRRAIRLFHHAFNGRNVVPRTRLPVRSPFMRIVI